MPFLSLISLVLAVGVTADYGIDVSSYVSQSGYSCLVQNGYDFAIVRGYCSDGQVDPNAVANINAAYSAGISHVDVYLFPCVPCGNPAGQVDSLLDAISGTGYGYVWLDIEVYEWTDAGDNINFIQGLMDELNNYGQSFGIYTNYYMWETITNLWTGPADAGVPLWYADYDGEADFSDFSAFGDWGTPNMKQYTGDASVCGLDVDQDWYPA